VPSVTVKSDAERPGARARKSKDAEPPTTVALGCGSSSTRTDSSEIARGAGHVRGHIDREAGVDRVDDGEGLHRQRGLRRDPHQQRLRRRSGRGVGGR
jgi:hypothetical protein